jgi:hypothetical protein
MAPLTPPIVVEDGDGFYHFDADFSAIGATSIVYRVSLNGVELTGQLYPTSTGAMPSLPVVADDKGVANMALAMISHTTQIVDIVNDQTVEARNARLFLPQARLEALGMYDWRWARKRAVLTQAIGTGDWWNIIAEDWGYVYTTPTDMLTPRCLKPGIRNPSVEDEVPFDTVRNATDDALVIVTDEPPLATADKGPWLFYTKLSTNAAEYPAFFTSFLAWWLARYLAGPVMGVSKGREARKESIIQAKFAFLDAVRCDNLGGKDARPMTPSLMARGARRIWPPRMM